VVIQITDPDTDLDHDTGKTALVEVCSVLVLLVSYVTTLVIYSKCRDFLLRVSLRLTCNSRLVQHTKKFLHPLYTTTCDSRAVKETEAVSNND